MVGEVIVKKAVPVREDHVYGEVGGHFIHVEVLLDEGPLAGSGGLFEPLHDGDEVGVSEALVGVAFVLAGEVAAEPEELEHVAVVIDAISSEEGAIWLFDEERVAVWFAVLPEADREALFDRHSGAAIDLIGEVFHERLLLALEDQRDGVHRAERLVLLEVNLLSAFAAGDLHEIEEFGLSGGGIIIDEGRSEGARFRRGATERARKSWWAAKRHETGSTWASLTTDGPGRRAKEAQHHRTRGVAPEIQLTGLAGRDDLFERRFETATEIIRAVALCAEERRLVGPGGDLGDERGTFCIQAPKCGNPLRQPFWIRLGVERERLPEAFQIDPADDDAFSSRGAYGTALEPSVERALL